MEQKRTAAQFFFEVGYGACWAEAYVQGGEKAPFSLTDDVIERAWEIAPEAHDDREEFDRYLGMASPDLLTELTEARTTLSILRTQVMVEIGRCADPAESRWEGVPEKLKDRLDAIDAVLARATTSQDTVS